MNKNQPMTSEEMLIQALEHILRDIPQTYGPHHNALLHGQDVLRIVKLRNRKYRKSA